MTETERTAPAIPTIGWPPVAAANRIPPFPAMPARARTKKRKSDCLRVMFFFAEAEAETAEVVVMSFMTCEDWCGSGKTSNEKKRKREKKRTRARLGQSVGHVKEKSENALLHKTCGSRVCGVLQNT